MPINKKVIKDNIKYLDNSFLTNELVDNRIKYLNNEFTKFNKLSIKEKLFKHNYNLFTKEELDNMLEECTDMIIEKIIEVGEYK